MGQASNNHATDNFLVPDGLIAWRVARLERAGLGPAQAQAVARDSRYDLHEVLGLIDRGCPAATAVRIVAPLGP